jgi:cupin fold WbuC family metalloprotein
MNRLHFVTRQLLDDVSEQARATPRLRKNYNLHASEKEPCNRLLNAMEPGTYIMPHCHADPTKDETMVMVRGRMGVMAFDGTGQVTEKAVMEAGGETCAVTIPHGVVHSTVALDPGTIFFEAKAGPYCPLTPQEKAAWAPAEGTPEASACVARFRQLFPV